MSTTGMIRRLGEIEAEIIKGQGAMSPGLVDRMLTIRYLETELQKLCDQGLGGDWHFNKGQEAIAVGVCAALRPSDRIVTHHRTIAHYIAKLGEHNARWAHIYR